jgi:hypothetical protein
MMLVQIVRCARWGVALATAMGALGMAAHAQATMPAGKWENPAAELAKRIADVLGPAPARLSLRNFSSIDGEDAEYIRRLLEDDLKSAGVAATNGDAVNAVRVTLSENTNGGLWVAEVVEGSRTQVVMESVETPARAAAGVKQRMTLHREAIVRQSELKWKRKQDADSVTQIVAAMELDDGLVVVTPERVALFGSSATGWTERDHSDFPPGRPASRDARGMVAPGPDEHSVSAFVPGAACTGVMAGAQGGWDVKCRAGDDFWPLVGTGQGAVTAFYNSGGDYFSGLVSPSQGTALPPFYSAGILAGRAGGPALLVGGIDGKVALAEGGLLKPVAGTRDWGSDFAVVNGSCAGTSESIVSSSGDGSSDSLRAYEVLGQEATASSEPLAVGGAVMAVLPSRNGNGVLAIIRTRRVNGGDDYEVDRVSATCN